MTSTESKSVEGIEGIKDIEGVGVTEDPEDTEDTEYAGRSEWRAVHDREMNRLEHSGWVSNRPLRSLLDQVGLTSPVEVVAAGMSQEQWARAGESIDRLRERFGRYRFAEEVEYGLLVVPVPDRLDTRGALPRQVREGQNSGLGEDFVDPALGPGADLSGGALELDGWRLYITAVSERGISAGSYETISAAQRQDFEIDGFDTRRLMIRQLWGARLLQSPSGVVPDSDLGSVWTFTLFPGEPLVEGRAVSGTVLKGKVRFRLGKTNRGIGSARVSPALPVRGIVPDGR
mgnify:FL=1